MNESMVLNNNEQFIINFTRSIIININQYRELLEDIFQQARMSFIMAFRNFNPNKSSSLQEYAKIYIKRDIFRLLGQINKDKNNCKNFSDIGEIYS